MIWSGCDRGTKSFDNFFEVYSEDWKEIVCSQNPIWLKLKRTVLNRAYGSKVLCINAPPTSFISVARVLEVHMKLGEKNQGTVPNQTFLRYGSRGCHKLQWQIIKEKKINKES